MERLVTPIISLIEAWPTGWETLLLWIIIFNLLAFGILGSSMGIKDFWKIYVKGIFWFLVISIILEGAIFTGLGLGLLGISIFGFMWAFSHSTRGYEASLIEIFFVIVVITPFLIQYCIFLAHKYRTLGKADIPPVKKKNLALWLTIISFIGRWLIMYPILSEYIF